MAKNKKDGFLNSRKMIRYFWTFYASVIGLVFLLLFLISMGWLGFMPSFEELENPKTNLATEVYSEDGHLLGKYYIENRSNVNYGEISPYLVNALLATEDARFYNHSGVDFKALVRVAFGVATFSHKGGGSTITQQLAKNLFPREPGASKFVLLFTKLKEWVVAAKLERNYTKEEIIAMYFNTVDFGNLSHGIKSASRTYFDKLPSEINTEEAALLVGMLKAPTYYSPTRNPENAIRRRNVVMKQMRKYDYIKKEEYDSLKALPIDLSQFHMQDHTAGISTYFREYLRQELVKWCDSKIKPDGTKYNIYKDGLKVYTTINYRMQIHAEAAVENHMGKDLQPSFFKHWKGVRNAPFTNINKEEQDRLMTSAMKRSTRYATLKNSGLSEVKIAENFKQKTSMRVFSWQGEKDTIMSPWDSILYYKMHLLTGVMAMEPSSGKIQAYVGGINYRHFQFDHVFQSKRQVGSTFKPFVYTLAMQEGELSPCSEVPNVPVSFEMDDGTIWTPRNSNDAHEGEMVSLKWALANSVNYVSAYLIKRYSPQAVVDLIRKLGITSEVPAVPSICLGTPDISVAEMTAAFSTYANKGVYIKPYYITKICDNKGNVIESFQMESREAIDEQTAYLMVRLMQGVVEGGTGSRLRYRYKLDMPIAGKTGTTQNNSDGWFMGYTPDIACGVWVGCEDRAIHFRSTNLGQGANMALPIWADFIQRCYNDKLLRLDKTKQFEQPSTPLTVETDCNLFKENQRGTNNRIFD